MTMSPEKKQTLKQLKVDNWGVFLLQRLQLMFAKGDCCDLTLEFNDHQELKVHKLVLATCTKYFETATEVNKTIKMPQTLTYSSMLPIINFMYSGKLEFKPELQDALLSAAQLLNISVLVQLLVAQKSQANSRIKSSIKVETKKIEKTLSPQASDSYQWNSSFNMFAEKKLPFWRKRSYPLLKMPFKTEPEDPRPTRFELPSNETNSLLFNVPSFTEISYESEPVVPSPLDFGQLKYDDLCQSKLGLSSSGGNKVQKLTESQIISGNWSDEDDDGRFEVPDSPDESDDERSTLPPRPILKPPADQPLPTPPKKVRFCLSGDQIETETPESKIDPLPQESPEVKPPELPKTESKEKPKEEGAPSPNHAKIIAEVLKKFPDLVKNNKNIKLKISSPSAGISTISLEGGKNLSRTQKSSIVLVKHSVPKGESTPTTVKPPVVDNKICEICGHKASKKNLHLYHMYTKHDIPPPKDVVFPKCSLCKFVAMSESSLAKHYFTHQSKEKNLICSICKLSFKSTGSFQAHCVTCKPDSEVRVFTCKKCNRVFRTNVSLKAHFKDCRSPIVEQDPLSIRPSDLAMEQPSAVERTVPQAQKEHSLVQLAPGIIVTDAPDVALLHPDADGSSTTIPDLGFAVLPPDDHRTVILLDENSEFFLRGDDSVVVAGENDEYIVPEILQDNVDVAQLYSASDISYTVNGAGVITYPVVHVRRDGTIGQHPADNVFLSDKEITVTDSYTEVKRNAEVMETHVEDPSLQRLSTNMHGSVSEPVNPGTCIVRIDDGCRSSDSNVCLVDSDTPISIMAPDGTITDTTPVNIVDPATPVSIVATDRPLTVIDSKPNVISLSSPTTTHTSPISANLLSSPQTDMHPTQPQHLSSAQVNPVKHQPVPVKEISTEWDFEADEEVAEIVDDPDSRPSRPSIELQEIV